MPRGIPKQLVLLTVLLGSPVIAAGAEQQEPATIQAAQRHYDSGAEFYKTGDYDAARIEFEAGFRLSKLPDFLVNLCQVAEKQNLPDDAIRYCEQYLRMVPGATDAADVQGRIDRLRLKLQESKALAQGVVVPAVTAKPPAVPTAVSIPAVRTASAPKPALALLVGGGALLVGALGTGVGSQLTKQQLEGEPYFDDVDMLRRRGEALTAASISLGIVGGAAVVAGASWLAHWRYRNNQAAH